MYLDKYDFLQVSPVCSSHNQLPKSSCRQLNLQVLEFQQTSNLIFWMFFNLISFLAQTKQVCLLGLKHEHLELWLFAHWWRFFFSASLELECNTYCESGERLQITPLIVVAYATELSVHWWRLFIVILNKNEMGKKVVRYNCFVPISLIPV